MRLFDESTEAFVCTECGNVGLGSGTIRCCDRPMDRAPVSDAVDDPTLDDLLGSVFDMSDTELELCLCVMTGGELTVAGLAEETGYDRSVVTRHLNHLVALDVVEKRRRLLERGGEVYVYTPVTPEQIRENLTRHFLTWVSASTRLLEELRREKVESLVEPRLDDPKWTIYQREST